MKQIFYFYNNMIITETSLLMTLLFLPVLVAVLCQVKRIIRLFKSVDKRILIILVAVFCFGFWLRNNEYRYGLSFDGVYYQVMAKSIYDKGELTQGCALGSPDNCLYKYPAVVLPGYPFLASILFKFFGVKDIFAMVISGILGSLTILLVFLLYLLLFENPWGALISAFIFSCLPIDVLISSTSAVRTTGIFFACLSSIFLLLALREKKTSLWVSAALCFSYAVYVRLDFYLWLIPCVVYLFLNRGRLDRPDMEKIGLSLVTFLIHQLPAFAWLATNHFGLTGGNEATFLLNRVAKASPVLLEFFFIKKFGQYYFNPVFSAFFIFGIVRILVSKKKDGGIFTILLFLVFFLGIASFYHGVSGKETIRYLQPMTVPYALLAAFAAEKIFIRFSSKKVFFVLLTFVSVFFILPNFKWRLFADGRMNEITIFEYRKYIDTLPSNALVFTLKPQLFELDLMDNSKKFVLVSFGQNQFDGYPGFKDAFRNTLFTYRNLKWFLILREKNPGTYFQNLISNVEMKRLDIEDLYADSELYEIIDKDRILNKLGQPVESFSSF